jgi:hypothetical protein
MKRMWKGIRKRRREEKNRIQVSAVRRRGNDFEMNLSPGFRTLRLFHLSESKRAMINIKKFNSSLK